MPSLSFSVSDPDEFGDGLRVADIGDNAIFDRRAAHSVDVDLTRHLEQPMVANNDSSADASPAAGAAIAPRTAVATVPR